MKRSACAVCLSLAALTACTTGARCAETASRLPATLVAELPAPIFPPPIESGASEKPLTMAEAEALAIAHHPALREAAAQVSAAQGKWVQVGLRPNPTIGYSGEEIGDDGKAGQQGGFISQEIVTAGKLRLNRDVALHEQQLAEQRVARTRLQVVTTVRKYYIEALVAEREVALATQLSDIARRSVDVSEQRLKALQVPKTALLQS
ncbi:MAG TPA: TolC family protein, partial [Lacipirellulaceae bacterium]|nr:TolC family protein [Lacipirellulaceae bacterium]